VVTPPPPPTPTPLDLSGNTNEQGEVQQTVTYSVLSGQSVLTIPAGTKVLTAAGQPLAQITVTEVCFNIPQSQCIIGCAYDYKPNGATFNPAVTLTIKYDQGLIPSGVNEANLLLAYYDTATSKWVTLTSTVDTANNKVSAQVSHFTMFAVYGCAPSVTATPPVTATPVVTPTPTPTPTEEGGLNIWVIIGPILGVIVIGGLVAYWFLKVRKPKPKIS
jgi:hypothetical protein